MSANPPVFDPEQLARQRYLSLPEAAAYLRFVSAKAFWMWAKRQGLRPCKAGRLNLYVRADLDAWIARSRMDLDRARPARLTRRAS